MAHKVEVSRYPEDEGVDLELLVICEVSGRYSPASYHHPAEYPDVEVLEVVEDTAERKPRPDLLALYEDDATVIDDACVRASDEEADSRADAMERRADADREDRLLGEGRYAP